METDVGMAGCGFHSNSLLLDFLFKRERNSQKQSRLILMHLVTGVLKTPVLIQAEMKLLLASLNQYEEKKNINSTPNIL